LLVLIAFGDSAPAKLVGSAPCTMAVPEAWSVSRGGAEARNPGETVRASVQEMQNGTLAMEVAQMAGARVQVASEQLTILKQVNGAQVRFIAIAPTRPERACQAVIVGTTREGVIEAASQARRVSPPRR